MKLALAAVLVLASPVLAAEEVPEVAGRCAYAGSTGADATMRFVFGGSAIVPPGIDPPDVVVVTCELVSPAQGIPGEVPEQRASVTCEPGPVCAIPPGVAGPWPMRPVFVCATGFAVFGSEVEDLAPACTDDPVPSL